MRCPKCHYLSFDPEPRCKNCGYSFSLSESDLTFHHEHTPPAQPKELIVELDPEEAGPREPEAPVARALRAEEPAAETAPPPVPPVMAVTPAAFEVPKVPEIPEIEVRETPAEPVIVVAEPPAPPRRVPPRAIVPAPTAELPLFVKGIPGEEAVEMPPEADEIDPALRVPLSSPPRPPLAVRRPSSAPPRKPGPLDRDLLEDLDRMDVRDRHAAALAASHPDSPAEEPDGRAGAGKRLTAALLDVALLGAVAFGVVWVTLRWCDLPLDRARDLPWLPTLAFLLLVIIGYVLMFTAASGQTVGKMLTGLRVVDDSIDQGGTPSLTTRRAVYRALLMVPSVLALGAGFLPALVGDERALHDRIAHTRVVRA